MGRFKKEANKIPYNGSHTGSVQTFRQAKIRKNERGLAGSEQRVVTRNLEVITESEPWLLHKKGKGVNGNKRDQPPAIHTLDQPSQSLCFVV